ncbi:MAG TPA: ABC transporter permease [Thermoanaerobaculia bacterium]|nr:ABC transporter permease [Thermoanaerobaculia bacterium]
MRRLWAVLKREYRETVRKPSFLVMTVLAPFLMAALMVVPALLAVKGMGERRVAILDGTGRLGSVVDVLRKESPGGSSPFARGGRTERQGGPAGKIVPEYVDLSAVDLKNAVGPFLARLSKEATPKEKLLDGVLLIPADAFDRPLTSLTYFSRSAVDLLAQERLGRVVNRTLQRQRLAARGLSPSELELLLAPLPVQTVQVTKSGQERTGGEGSFVVAMVFMALLFIPSLVYGQEVMRGVIQEKTDRVVEILVSSMTPMELLSGKILGMAAVGLTQMAVWMAMGALLLGSGLSQAQTAGLDLSTILRPSVAVWFVVFFLLSYLVTVGAYAAGGSIVSSEKEAQQVLTPVMLLFMVPWFLMMPILTNPDSTLSVVLSLVPIYTPMTMFVRILVSEPPAWQVALSLVLSVATIAFLLKATAKIFRAGLLATGKRPTIPELWRWLKAA